MNVFTGYIFVYTHRDIRRTRITNSLQWLASPHLHYVFIKPTNNNEARYPNGQFNGMNQVLDTPE
jgi:hypothetical protein